MTIENSTQSFHGNKQENDTPPTLIQFSLLSCQRSSFPHLPWLSSEEETTLRLGWNCAGDSSGGQGNELGWRQVLERCRQLSDTHSVLQEDDKWTTPISYPAAKRILAPRRED